MSAPTTPLLPAFCNSTQEQYFTTIEQFQTPISQQETEIARWKETNRKKYDSDGHLQKLLLVFTGLSGVGKDSIYEELKINYPSLYSYYPQPVSRAVRDNEKGRRYRLPPKEFQEKLNKEKPYFIANQIGESWYGIDITSKFIHSQFHNSNVVILDTRPGIFRTQIEPYLPAEIGSFMIGILPSSNIFNWYKNLQMANRATSQRISELWSRTLGPNSELPLNDIHIINEQGKLPDTVQKIHLITQSLLRLNAG